MPSKTVRLILDSTHPDAVEEFEVDSIVEALRNRLGVWPATARIYRGATPSVSTDITPMDGHAVDLLENEDVVTVVVYPAGEITAAGVIQIVLFIIAVAAAIYFRPKIPGTPRLGEGGGDSSPNNLKSDRQNRARPKSRIPDIYGTVQSTPDLITVPYSRYSNFRQTEFATLCIGRGQFVIDTDLIKEGNTKIADIGGYSVEIFNPGTDIDAVPDHSSGVEITEPPYFAEPILSARGQGLSKPYQKFASVFHADETGEVGPFDNPFDPNPLYRPAEGEVLRILDVQPYTHEGFETFYIDVDIARIRWLWETLFPGVPYLAYQKPFENEFVLIESPDVAPPNIKELFQGFADRAMRLDSVPMHWLQTSGSVFAKLLTPFLTKSFMFVGNEANGDNFLNGYNIGDSIVLSGTHQWTHPTDGSVDFIYSGTYVITDKPTAVGGVTIEFEGGPEWQVYTIPSAAGRFPIIVQSFTDDIGLGPTTEPLLFNIAGAYVMLDTATPDQIRLVATEEILHLKFLSTAYATNDSNVPSFADVPFFPVSLETATAIEEVDLGTVDFGPAANSKKMIINLVAASGMYIVNAGNYSALSAEVTITAQGASISALNTTVIAGSPTITSNLRWTIEVEVTELIGEAAVTVVRNEPEQASEGQTVLNDVAIDSAFVLNGFKTGDYGDVTVIRQMQTVEHSTKVPDRRLLNLPVQRMLQIDEVTFEGTDNIGPIIKESAIDPYIGGMDESFLDEATIDAEVAEIDEYFGDSDESSFGYTFDDAGMSYEEMLSVMANAAFCTAYRLGGKIAVEFEHQTKPLNNIGLGDAVIVIGPHNTIPETATRAFTFGIEGDNDGVVATYRDSTSNDEEVEYTVPTSGEVFNPQRITLQGVRNVNQAAAHANRIWQRKLWVHETIEIGVTQEAAVLKFGDIVAIATPGEYSGTTSPNVNRLTGLVTRVDAENLTLDPPLPTGTSEATLIMQSLDGSVQELTTTAITADGAIVTLPLLRELNLDENAFARASYTVASFTLPSATEQAAKLYRVTGVSTEDGLKFVVSAEEYRAEIYSVDGVDAAWLIPDDSAIPPIPDPDPAPDPIPDPDPRPDIPSNRGAGPLVVLLLHCDGVEDSTTFIDGPRDTTITIPQTVAATDNAKVITTVSHFGGASADLLSSFAQLVVTPFDDSFDFDGEFCIDLWAYLAVQQTGFDRVIAHYGGFGQVQEHGWDGEGFEWLLRLLPSGEITFEWYDGDSTPKSVTSSGVDVSGEFHHICVASDGASVYLYVDGIFQDSLAGTITHITAGAGLQFGRAGTIHWPWIGFLDEIRISNGTSGVLDAEDPLYISSLDPTDGFVPPTEAYRTRIPIINGDAVPVKNGDANPTYTRGE